MLSIFSDTDLRIKYDYIKNVHNTFLNFKKENKNIYLTDVFFLVTQIGIDVIEKRSSKGKLLSPSNITHTGKLLSENVKCSLKSLEYFNPSVVEFIKELNQELEQLERTHPQTIQNFKNIQNTNAPKTHNIQNTQRVAREVLKTNDQQPNPLVLKSTFKLPKETNERLLLVPNDSANRNTHRVFAERVVVPNELIRHTILAMMEKNPLPNHHLDEIISFLTLSIHTPKLVDSAKNQNTLLFFQLFKLALLKGALLASDNNFEFYEYALNIANREVNYINYSNCHPNHHNNFNNPNLNFNSPHSLNPLIPILESSDEPQPDITLKNIALIFGDAFIKNSGIEGDISSGPYADLVLSYMKAKNLMTPRAKRLEFTLKNALSFENPISPTQLKERILDVIAKCPPGPNGEKRCLLFGGWVKHAIVYEIEKKTNENFVFRVFNQGDGVNNHLNVMDRYRKKFACYYSIDDIEEDILLRPAFLANLQALTSEAEGADFLYHQILPILGNKHEKIEDYAFMDIQKSGTCTYPKSYLDHELGQLDFMTYDDRARFYLEFKVFILKTSLPKLKTFLFLDKKTKNTKDLYKSLVFIYNLLNKCVQEFSDEIQKKHEHISYHDLLDARKLLLEYKVLLRSMQKQLFHYEKNSVQLLCSLQPDYYQVNFVKELEIPEAKGKTFSHITDDTEEILNLIERLPASKNDPYLIKNILIQIVRNIYRLPLIEKKLVLDRFFKTLGTFEDFQKLNFGNNAEISEMLDTIDSLMKKIEHHSNQFEEHWKALFLTAFYVLSEIAFNQLPPRNKVFLGHDISFLHCMAFLPKLVPVFCLDFYWFDFIYVLNKRKEKTAGDNILRQYLVPNHSLKQFKLTDAMIESILAYWKSLPKIVMNQIDSSIAHDETMKEKEIESRIKKIDEKLNSLIECCQITQKGIAEFEQRNLWKEDNKEILNDFKMELEYFKKLIDQKNVKRTAIPLKVEKSGKYWPKGWKIDGVKNGGISEKEKANFIFANHEFFFEKIGREILLLPFQTFFLSATRAANALTPSINYNYQINYQQNDQESFLQIHQSQQKNASITDDLISSFETDQWRDLFKAIENLKVFEKSPSENSAPKISSDLKNTLNIDDLTSEELREILAWGHEEIRIEAMLGYFMTNAEKLRNQNWFVLFYAFLFRSRILLDTLSNFHLREKTIYQFECFFEKIKAIALSKSDFSLLGDLMMLKGSIKKSLLHTAKNPKEKADCVDLSEVRQILQIALKEEFKSQWPALFEGLAAYCAQVAFTQGVQNQDSSPALLLNLLRIQHPVEKPFKLRSKVASSMEIKLSEIFKRDNKKTYCLKKEDIDLLRVVFPRIVQLYPSQIHQENLSTIDGKTEIFLSSGSIITNDRILLKQYSARLPEHVIVKFAGLFNEEEAQRLRYKSEGFFHYIFDPMTKVNYFYSYAKDSIYIEIETKPGKKEWCLYLQKPKSSKDFRGKYLFLAIRNELYLCDKTSFQVRYSLDSNNHLIDKETGLRLGKQSSKVFRNFELHVYCFFWIGDEPDNLLKKIDFPRMNLSFKLEEDREKPKVFRCIQQPEWFISDTQFAPHIGPPTGFISIENDAGQKKVILPVFDSHREDDLKKYALNYPFEYHYQKEAPDIRTVEYDLIDNQLIPKSLEARYQLAYIYLEKGFTELGENLLFSNQAEITTRPLSAEERVILERIVKHKSGEESSQKIRCRLHALYLLERDTQTMDEKNLKPGLIPSSFRISENIQEDKNKIELYWDYLRRLEHIKPIDPREELLIHDLIHFLEIEYLKLGKEKCDPISTHMLKVRRVELEGKFHEENVLQVYLGVISNALFARFAKTSIKFNDEQAKGLLVKREEPEKISLAKRMNYSLSRLKNHFPFSFDTPKEFREGFNEFYPCIYAETLSLKNLTKTRESGLMAMLSFASISFPEDQKLQALLVVMNDKNREDWKAHTHKTSHEIAKPKCKSNGLKIQKYTQNLEALKHLISASDVNTFLVYLAQKYLIETKAHPQSLKAPLFDPNAPEAGDSSIKERFNSMQEDLRTAEKLLNNEMTYQEINGQSLKFLEKEIKHRLRIESEKLASQESQTVAAVHIALTDLPELEFQFSSRKRQLPSMQELALFCAKIDGGASLQKMYPELSDDAVENLRHAIQQYLLQKTSVQHLSRTADLIQNILEENGPGRKYSIDRLGNSLKSSNNYQGDKLEIVFMLLEAVLNIRLRKDQFDLIYALYDAKLNKEDRAAQMIMGAGKTTVIQPLLAILFATPGRLSTVTVPAHLYSLVQIELGKLLGESYGRSHFLEPFTKKLAQYPSFLITYLNRLKDAMGIGAAVLLTPQHKYSIYSSLKEAYALNDQKRADLLADITQLLDAHEIAQIDEVDMIMDPTIVYKFPIGPKTFIDKKRAAGIADMMVLLLNDKAINSEIFLDFFFKFHKKKNPNSISKGRALTPELYQKVMIPKLVKIAKELFFKEFKVSPDHNLQGLIQSFLSQETPFDLELQAFDAISLAPSFKRVAEIGNNKNELKERLFYLPKGSIDFLMASKFLFVVERNEALATHLNEEQCNYLGAFAKSIHHILKKSLFEEGGVHYSVDPKTGVYTARSYYAPNSPKPSVPCDPYEMLIKSIQNTYYNGIPRAGVEKTFAKWQKEALNAIEDGEKLSDCFAYQQYRRVMGARADKYHFFQTPSERKLIDHLMKKMNVDEQCIEGFIKDQVFKQVGFYAKSIETTPQTLIGLSAQTLSYSASLSQGILSLSMKPQLAAGTDGKTTTVVSNKIAETSSEIIAMNLSQGTYLDQVLKLFQNDIALQVFIDSGNWLKEEKIENWAKKLFLSVRTQPNRGNIQGVIYPDSNEKWISLEVEEGKLTQRQLELSKLTPDQRLTIIPSKHETGTNIHQVSTAKAFQSIRKEMKLRDMLQSVFRMRLILQGQQVMIGINKEVKDHIATLLIQELLKNEPYKSCLKSGVLVNLPHQLPLERWFKLTLIKAGASQSIDKILSIGCETFVFENKQEHLWNYFLKNQVEDEYSKNVLALDHRMREVLDKPMRKILIDSKIPYEKRKGFFDLMDDFYVIKQEDSPFAEMTAGSQRTPIGIVVEVKKEKLRKFYSRLVQIPDVKELIDENINRLYSSKEMGAYPSPSDVLEKTLGRCVEKELLPDFVEINSIGAEAEIEQDEEVEQEKQADAQVDLEFENQVVIDELSPLKDEPNYVSLIDYDHVVEATGYDPIRFCNPLGKPTVFFTPVTKLLTSSTLQDLVGRFPLAYSPNLFYLSQLPSEYFLPGHFMLAIKDAVKDVQFLLVTHEDAAYIKKGMLNREGYSRSSCVLVSFDGQQTASFGQSVNWQNYDIEKAILFGKLLTGRVDFKKEEIERLQLLINHSMDPEKSLKELRHLFESIIKYKHDSLEKYNQNSKIKTFFDQCKNPNQKSGFKPVSSSNQEISKPKNPSNSWYSTDSEDDDVFEEWRGNPIKLDPYEEKKV